MFIENYSSAFLLQKLLYFLSSWILHLLTLQDKFSSLFEIFMFHIELIFLFILLLSLLHPSQPPCHVGDVMRNKWSVSNILAIDVGSQYETQFTNYGDCLSGWSVLFRRVFPFKYFFRKELRVRQVYEDKIVSPVVLNCKNV